MDINKQSEIKKLGEIIEGIEFAMMTTIDLSGQLRSRPMATQRCDFDGMLWFFSADHSAKNDELAHDPRVNLSYEDKDKNRYISISGSAVVMKDRDKARELWNPLHRAWFPNGPDDPDLSLIRIEVEQAEYWDFRSGKMVALVSFVKGLARGEPEAPEMGNQKITLTKAAG